jgi:hypothetical protein
MSAESNRTFTRPAQTDFCFYRKSPPNNAEFAEEINPALCCIIRNDTNITGPETLAATLTFSLGIWS